MIDNAMVVKQGGGGSLEFIITSAAATADVVVSALRNMIPQGCERGTFALKDKLMSDFEDYQLINALVSETAWNYTRIRTTGVVSQGSQESASYTIRMAVGDVYTFTPLY